MQYEEFLQAVMADAGIEERAALVASEATLKTLGESLSESEATRVAAQLPPLIGRFLTVVDTNKNYDLEAFYQHVAERAHLDADAARAQSQAVLGVVRRIVPLETLQAAVEPLPEDLQKLLDLPDA